MDNYDLYSIGTEGPEPMFIRRDQVAAAYVAGSSLHIVLAGHATTLTVSFGTSDAARGHLAALKKFLLTGSAS